MRARRGHSIIEMLLIVSLLTVVLGLSAGVIGLLERTERAQRSQVGDAERLSLLAREFRSDVHAAVALEETPEPGSPVTSLRLLLGDEGSVEYRTRVSDVLVIRREGEDEPRRKTVELPSGAVARLEVETWDEHQWLILSVLPAGAGSSSEVGAREVRVLAMLGRDHRDETGGEP